MSTKDDVLRVGSWMGERELGPVIEVPCGDGTLRVRMELPRMSGWDEVPRPLHRVPEGWRVPLGSWRHDDAVMEDLTHGVPDWDLTLEDALAYRLHTAYRNMLPGVWTLRDGDDPCGPVWVSVRVGWVDGVGANRRSAAVRTLITMLTNVFRKAEVYNRLCADIWLCVEDPVDDEDRLALELEGTPGFERAVLREAVRLLMQDGDAAAMVAQAVRRSWSALYSAVGPLLGNSYPEAYSDRGVLDRGDMPLTEAASRSWCDFLDERSRHVWLPLRVAGRKYVTVLPGHSYEYLDGPRVWEAVNLVSGIDEGVDLELADAVALRGAEIAFVTGAESPDDLELRALMAYGSTGVYQSRRIAVPNRTELYSVLVAAPSSVFDSMADALDGSELPEPDGICWNVVALPPEHTGTARVVSMRNLSHLSMCNRCRKLVDLTGDDPGHRVDGRRVCGDCFEQMDAAGELHHCTACGNHTCEAFDGAIGSPDDDDEVYCEDCYNEEFYECDSCGVVFHRGELNDIVDEDDRNRVVCDECMRRYQGVIHGYSYKPSPVFHGTAPDKRYFGLEIETGGNYADQFAEELFDTFGDLMYCKHDSSISSGRDVEDCEVVTHPMSYDYAMNVNWDEFHFAARNHDMTSHDLGTCGFHIHVSRDGLGGDHYGRELNAAKLVVFFDEHYDELLRFSRRRPSEAREWATKNCIGVTPGDDDDDVRRKCSGFGRYCAVNIRNGDTVEIRLWRGTTKASTIRSTIDMTAAIVGYVVDTPTKELIARAGDSLWELLGDRLREETLKYMTVRGLNPVADLEPDGEDD